MYALPKGNANKLLVKTRRGVPQTLDSPRDLTSERGLTSRSPEVMSPPKPVFLHDNGNNGKKGHNNNVQRQKSQQDNKISPQHKELVKYIHETWKCVKKEYEKQGSVSSSCLSSESAALSSVGQVPSHSFRRPSFKKDFEPFDLEAFWGKRLFERLTN